jgi:N-acetylmuramoyl-L-alanine amidase
VETLDMLTRRILLGHATVATFSLPAAAAGVPPRPARAKAKALVFLDPGHGGKDPGAIGVSGTFEKDVALATAGQLRHALEATGRYRVALSRGADVFIPLEQRVAIAQDAGAELFVSMHADALTDHSVRGASVYTLSDQASDRQTAALARRENAADRFAGPGFRGTSPEVAAILASLVREETRAGSARMARAVVAELQGSVGLLQNPARHAGFVVLKAPDIPSVLVEMGFMSNSADENALRRTDHRAKIAAALLHAVDAFFAQADALRMAG